LTKTSTLILIFILNLPSIGFTQDSTNPKKLIGFACFFDGAPSDIVNKVTLDLQEHNYKKVLRKLKSKNPAKRYLAVIVAERLSALDKYQLTATDKLLIADAYQSTDLITICAGCTYFAPIELRKLLSEEQKHVM
ncbi:MAG: hypothetical protein AAF734_01530, partial [Bacteroidota bacterium]